MNRPFRTVLASAIVLAAVSAQDPQRPQSRPGIAPPGSPPQLPAGSTRESMWPAPTAEDWQRPVAITFQRSWDDAVAVARETGKAILICVNMDGEIASEHYAGIRYRDPAIAKLYEPYVCVVASVYRHNARDHDENGERILCPRFGSVTCGEHIAIEPILYERYMDGQRVAPRHIMVELDGTETYDVMLAWDTDSVFKTIERGILERPTTPPILVRGDRPVVERVASRDIADRRAVEAAYRAGDAAERRKLLEAALQNPGSAPTDLLRLAVFGLDTELAKLARHALANLDDPGAVDLIAEALKLPSDSAERDALVAALERIGQRSPAAHTLAIVHSGLATESKAVDVAGWTAAMDGGASYAPPPDREALEARVAAGGASTDTDPNVARVGKAEAALLLAVDPETNAALAADPRNGRRFSRLMFEDAKRLADDAEAHGARGWRIDAVQAVTAAYLGDKAGAHARAVIAASAMPPEPQDWLAVATLALFAEARQDAIWDALRAKSDWPKEWMTDANAAYSVLARHPLGTAHHALMHYDFLNRLGAKGRAGRVLDDALRRFPDAWALHDRLRDRILEERGAAGLEPTYAALLARDGTPPGVLWFAGYASLVAAEFHRRAGEPEPAVAAYERAIGLYDRAVAANPDARANSDHYVALALAGEARIALERGDLEQAVGRLIASFERCPAAAGSLDGLNLSPSDTSRTLLARLREQERADLIAKLEAARAKLDPALLQLPAYERIEPPAPRRR